jgi:DNA-binding MarR family transcriptional regulator
LKEDKIAKYFDDAEELSHRLMRKIHQDISKENVGVTGSQYLVLKRLHENGNMTVSEVAEDLGGSLSAVTALVDRLCKAELANRKRDDKDRRLVWLEITALGKEKVEICDASRRRVLHRYFSKLDDDDLSRLIEINEKLRQIFKEEE